jgi:glycogen debranching enzyme
MDARVDGVPVTQRAGKPVGVNALWLRALAVTASVAEDESVRARLTSLREQAAASFATRFVRPDGVGLFDVVDGRDGDDASLRPNQLLAVALPDSPLESEAARRIVEVCSRALLTPLGLRSLARDDSRYRPFHRGDPADRDGAYHQGTVWPWLLGPFVDAAHNVDLPLDGIFDGIDAHLSDWGLGSVSETADGAKPHAATGCPFQAWSVAEVLRARREPQLDQALRSRTARRVAAWY